MIHLPELIRDLALILGAAAITTLLFKKLKQPVVLGYIIAGLLVGPNFNLLPTVLDTRGVELWAKLGVIFLLFSLGLEFSFKKLARVGGASAITGIYEISLMLIIGFFAGQMMGWTTMDSIFLGAIISISSTTIIIRAFDELKVKNQSFAGRVLGILIIEDLVAVLLLVVLATLSHRQQFEGMELLFSIAKLLFFLCVWFLSGIFVLPSLLRAFKKLMSDETLLVVSLALCFFMVALAAKAGFSEALGAFIMGSILAETTHAEKIEQLVKSVKDLFAAVFFVSVGMLINPAVLVAYAGPVLLLTVIVIVGKTVNVTVGALIAGQPLRQSIQTGMSMSQIGEFSFIIANLGLSFRVISPHLYPLAVGVSVITTFTTPYMIRMAEPLYFFLEKKFPNRLTKAINRYSSGAQTIQAESDWKVVLRAYMVMILVNSVVIVSLILLSVNYLAPVIRSYTSNNLWGSVFTAVVTIGLMSPFVWALTLKKLHKIAYTNLWLDKKYNRGPLVMLEVLRNLLAVVFLFILMRQLFSAVVSVVVVLIVLIVVGVIFQKRLQDFYSRIEQRFISNLNARDQIDGVDEKSNLSPWDAHLAFFTISPNVGFIGKTLEALCWREKYGINIAAIERGQKVINVPSRYEQILPYDKISVIGTDAQLKSFRNVIDPTLEPVEAATAIEEVSLNKIIVDHHNQLRGKTIRNSGIRERTGGLVVGIERGGLRLLNPESTLIFEWEDVVWIVGERKKIEQLSAVAEA